MLGSYFVLVSNHLWLQSCIFGLQFQCFDLGPFDLGLWPCSFGPHLDALHGCHNLGTQLQHCQRWNQQYLLLGISRKIDGWSVRKGCLGVQACHIGKMLRGQHLHGELQLGALRNLLCFRRLSPELEIVLQPRLQNKMEKFIYVNQFIYSTIMTYHFLILIKLLKFKMRKNQI